MTTLSITNNIDVVWKLHGFDHYGFGKDKNLYNTQTGRVVRHTIVGYSKGWWIGKKFITHNKMKQILYKPVTEKIPF